MSYQILCQVAILLMFADDTKFKSLQNHLILQQDLDNLGECCAEWQSGKCPLTLVNVM